MDRQMLGVQIEVALGCEDGEAQAISDGADE